MKKQIAKRITTDIKSKQKIIYSIITFSIPILLFIILEIALRIFNYGYDLSPFKTKTIGEKSYFVMDPSVKNRYFDQINFTPSTSSDYFQVIKPKGTFRIFCLGGSTTVGYPYWYNGSFSSFLRDRLKAIFPNRSIEVMNVGMTATNSFTVLDLCKDLVNYEPDLFIVYDGHN